MKKLLIIVQVVLCITFTSAQGIKFTDPLNWDQIIEKARKENKRIFVDCYASWCAPCKTMDQEVFSNKTVGDFFNREFINVKIQFDSTSESSEAIKRMSSIAREFEKTYKISIFPTYLFFDMNGKILAQEIGAILPYEVFLQKAKSLSNPEEQYYTLRERYLSGQMNHALVKKLIYGAVKLQDWKIAYQVHDQFVNSIDTPYTKDDLLLIYSSIPNSNGAGFNLILSNMKENDAILDDEGRSKSVLIAHLKKESYDLFIKSKTAGVDWDSVGSYIEAKAPRLVTQAVMELKINYLSNQKKWEEFGKLKMDYYDKYFAEFDHNARFFMNNELMQVFLLCNNRETLMRARKYSKKSIYVFSDKENSAAMDTYANILYKLGKVKEAIKWQQKAVGLVTEAKDPDLPEYLSNLKKMKDGIPTWEVK